MSHMRFEKLLVYEIFWRKVHLPSLNYLLTNLKMCNYLNALNTLIKKENLRKKLKK